LWWELGIQKNNTKKNTERKRKKKKKKKKEKKRKKQKEKKSLKRERRLEKSGIILHHCDPLSNKKVEISRPLCDSQQENNHAFSFIYTHDAVANKSELLQQKQLSSKRRSFIVWSITNAQFLSRVHPFDASYDHFAISKQEFAIGIAGVIEARKSLKQASQIVANLHAVPLGLLEKALATQREQFFQHFV
jgi:hypothetical protein